MHCHVCNVAVGDGQRFCHACGESLAGVTDATQPIDATDGPSASGADSGAVAEDADELLDSETVVAPPIPETESGAHRGELPDVAGATPIDESWWDGTGVKPDPELMPQPPTQPIDAVESSPGTASAVPKTNSLDSVPDDPAMAGAAAAGAGLASTSMMALTEPDAAETTTDEFAHHGEPAGEAGLETSQMSAVFDGGSDVYADGDHYSLPEESQGFRLRASFVFSLLGVVAALMASVADLIDIRTSRPVDGIIVGFRTMDDFGTNLSVAGFIGTALMLVGGLASCFGMRWGAGLAGGSGLALVGWSALVLGRVEVPIHTAQQVTRSAGNDVNPFMLSITRDLGWFLVLAVAVLGFIVFLVSLRMAGTGGRPPLNPWLAAVGALAMVIAAAGPLIPLGGAALDVNLGTGDLPREFFAGRLIQVGLIAATGVVGFLSVRNYGLGFAAGGIGVAVWLWLTSLTDLGDRPVSVAIGNIGTLDTTPHAVTSVGLSASIVLLAVASTMSYLTRPRH